MNNVSKHDVVTLKASNCKKVSSCIYQRGKSLSFINSYQSVNTHINKTWII